MKHILRTGILGNFIACAVVSFLFTASVNAQTVIGVQDFEAAPATPTLTFTTSDIGTPGLSTGISSGTTLSTDAPASSNLFASGAKGYRMQGPASGSTATARILTFSAVNTSTYSNVFLSFRVAGMSMGSNANGMDNSTGTTILGAGTIVDFALVEVSPDNGTTWFQQGIVAATTTTNVRWSFGATGIGTRGYLSSNLFSTFPTTGTATITSGTTAVTTATITSLPSVSNLRIRITLESNSANESWIIDDVTIKGTACVAPVISAITNDGPKCANGTLSLNVSATGATPLAYAWTGNGTFSSTSVFNPTVTGMTAGSQIYTVTVTNSCGLTASSTTTATINATVTPTISVSASPSSSVCPGTNVTFTAAITNGGTSPSYTWKLDGNVVGLNSPTYSNNGLTNGQLVTCVLTSNATCASPTNVTSSPISVTIFTPPVASCTATNVTTANGTDGTATVTASSGTGPYSYLWSNSATTASIGGLSAGTYTVIVTDINGCTATCSSVVAQPAASLIANCSIVSNVSCFGGSNGSASVTATGGTGAGTYSYLWSNSQTGATATGLSAGTYTVTVTDGTPTTATCSVTILQPAAVTPMPTSNTPVCNGSSINLSTTVTGGTGAYTYSWSGPNGFSSSTATASVTASVLSAGSYTLTVTDANSCIGSASTSVVVLANPAIAVTATPATICAGQSSTLNATGGATYSWNPTTFLSPTSGATVVSTPTSTISYIVTGTSASGCIATATTTVTVNPLPTVGITPSSVTILTGRNTILTGTGASSYSWNPGAGSGTTFTVSPTSTTIYTVTGTASGCSATATATVTVINSFVSGNIIVDRVGDGSTALGSGSAPIFLDQYNVSTGGLVGTVAVPTSGTTRTTIGGSSSAEGYITRTPSATAIAIPGYDAATGVASISGTTGSTVNRVVTTIDYAQNFTRSAASTSYSGQSIRGAVVNGTNVWGSAATGGTILLPLSGAGVTIQTTSTNNRVTNIFNNQLYFSTGAGTPGIYSVGSGLPTAATTATIVVGTGTGSSPYGFSFNGTTTVCYISDDRSAANGGGIQKWVNSGSSWSLSYTLGNGSASGSRGLLVDFSGANPVIYAVTSETPLNRLIKIIDTGALSVASTIATAITNTAFRNISFAPECPFAQKPTITTNTITGSCATGSNGAIDITASAGTGPYTFSWSNSTTNEDLSGVAPGVYTVTVMDNAGCSNFASITVPSVGSPSPVITGTLGICTGGSTTLSAGSFSSYLWSPNGETTSSITASATGTYSVTVTNASGCTGSTSATVVAFPPPAVSITGNTVFCTGGGTTLDAGVHTSYLWSTSSTTQSINITTAGTYTVTVSNSNGCTASTSVTVTQQASISVAITGSLSYCAGSSTTLSAGVGYDTYLWTPGSASTSSLVVNSPGTYSVTVTSGSCTGSSSVSVTENPLPIVSISPSSIAICSGQTTTLLASGANSYSWSPVTALSSTVTASVNANPTANTTYTVTGTNLNSCTATFTTSVTVNPLPSITVTPLQQASCAGTPAALTASGGLSYTWSPATGLNTTTGSSVSATPASTTIYTATGTNSFACTSSATATVIITPQLAAPTVNTPSFDLCQNAPSPTISVSPNPAYATLLYYSVPTGGTASTLTPVVSTATPGLQTFYVSQTINSTSGLRIAITGYIDNGPSVDLFRFVALTDIPVGTKIYFTDNGWTGTQFRGASITDFSGGEDIVRFDANVTIPAGTAIVSYTSSPFYTWVTTGKINAAAAVSSTNNQYNPLALSTTGDQIYAFTSTNSNPLLFPTTHLFVFDATGLFEGATNTNEGAVPPGLSVSDGTAVTMVEHNYLALTDDGFIRSLPEWYQYISDTTNHYVKINGANSSLPVLSNASINVTNACESPRSSFTVNVNAGPIPGASAPMAVCIGGNIQLGSDPNFEYADWNWTGPNGFSAISEANPFLSGVTSAASGAYTVVVSDFGGCTASQTVNVFVSVPIATATMTSPVLCHGGTTTVSVSATGGYNTYSGTGTFTVSSGSYTYTVIDAIGCSSVTSITITEPTATVASASATPIVCFGNTSSVTVSAIGGTSPYTGTGTFSALAGTYTYTVRDANGCNSTTSINISQPSQLIASATFTTIVCNGGSSTVTVSAGGGTPGYTGTGINSQFAGSYTYTVTDQNACTAVTSVTITQPLAITIGSFTPNNGCFGDSVTILGTNMENTIALSFNGTSATFVVISSSEVHSAVPAGASTGLITITNSAGCMTTSSSNFTVNSCSTGSALHLKMFIQGYYSGGGSMEPAVFIEGEPSATANDVEYVTVSLMDPTLLTAVESLTGRLQTDGSLVLNYTVAASSNSYYIKVRTRNLIETWSAAPVILGPVTNYDFSNNNLKAYQDINNTFTQQYEVEPGVWAMYNGDVNQDGTIDGQDFNDTETDVNNFSFGYFATDIFNAGPVDGQDFNQLELNSGFFLFVAHP